MRALLDSLPFLKRAAGLALLAAALCLTACSSETPSATEGTADNGLTVTIGAPKAATGGAVLIVSGMMGVSGTVTAPAGIKPKTVKVTFGTKTYNGAIQGSAWSVQPIDTATIGKDGAATILVEATGTGDAAGSASLDVVVDNTAPTVEFLTPKGDEPLAADGGVVVGKVPVGIKVADKNFASATLQWATVDDAGNQLEDFQTLLPGATGPTGAAITKPGSYSFLLDRSAAPTSRVRFKLTAVDNAKKSVEANITVHVLKQPHFQGNSDEADGFQDEIRDMQLADMNADGIIDAVLATDKGVALRYGVPSAEDKQKGSGRFEPLKDPDAGMLIVTGKMIPGGSMTHVLLTDLDADGDQDVIAVGVAPFEVVGKDGTKEIKVLPAALALLNVQYDTVDKAGKVTPGRALKLLETKELPDEAFSVALGDFNADGQQDVIVGSKNAKGLTTLLLQKDPQCKVAGSWVPCLGVDKPTPADKVPISKVTAASIFPKETHSMTHFGVTAISSIAVADFYSDANKALDVCVGEAARPVISCYRNLKRDGSFEQAQDSYTMTDASDTRLILATKWNTDTADDTPDLIVASSNGIIRWLAGDHEGTFTFPLPDPTVPAAPGPPKYREIIHMTCSGMWQAPIGPDGKPYLLLVESGRVGTVAPILLNDTSHVDMCFRSWILGGSIRKIAAADINNDKLLDLVALDGAPGVQVPDESAAAPPGTMKTQPSGLAVAFGRPNGDFLAPSVHHLCAWNPDGDYFGTHTVNALAFSDFSGDQMADLMLIGKRSWSLQGPISGYCKEDKAIKHKWAWAFHLYSNASADGEVRLNPAPRGGEFAPNAAGQTVQSGASADCPGDDTPKSFGSVKDLAVADMDGDGSLDLVAVRDESDYPLGLADGDASEGCPQPCSWNDANEVNNVFGIDAPKPTETTPVAPIMCCKNYASSDKDKQKVLHGYGGANAAPLDRASAFVFANGNKPLTPFGLDTNAKTWTPKVIAPVWAMSAGVNPMAVAAADFNNDKVIDIATLMQEKGSDQDKDKQYLEARVRFFKGKPGKVWEPVDQPKGDTWPWINPDSGQVAENVAVKYRTVGRSPTAMVTAPLGKDGLMGIYTLGSKYGNFSFLESLGNMGFKVATHTVVGPTFGAFVAQDINPNESSSLTDVIYILQDTIGVLLGNDAAGVPTFTAGNPLVQGTTNVNFVDTVDANQDGFLDLMMIDTSNWSVVFYLGANNGRFVRYQGKLRVLEGSKRIQRSNLVAQDPAAPKCFDLAVQSPFGATVLRNLDCN